MGWINLEGKNYFVADCDYCARQVVQPTDELHIAEMEVCPNGCTQACEWHIDDDFVCSVCGEHFNIDI